MGSYRLTQGPDQILKVHFEGDMREEETQAYHDEVAVIFEQAPTPVGFVLYGQDVNTTSGNARRIMRKVVGHPMCGPTAILGVNRYLSVAATFVFRAAGNHNFRFFNDEATAFRWVKQQLVAQHDPASMAGTAKMDEK